MLESKGKYCITKKNLSSHELNGLKAKVMKSPHPGRVGASGVIVKETKNVFVLEQKNGKELVLPKKEVVLEIEIGEKRTRIEGKRLCFRPEERIKKSK